VQTRVFFFFFFSVHSPAHILFLSFYSQAPIGGKDLNSFLPFFFFFFFFFVNVWLFFCILRLKNIEI